MSVENTQSTEEWCIPCLPESEEFEPTPEELDDFYLSLEKGIALTLEGNYAKNLPSPELKESKLTDSSDKTSPTKNQEFDFLDEVSLPQMRVRQQNSTPKGSAKKKTASFASVMDAMKKHRLTTSTTNNNNNSTTTTPTKRN